MPVNDCKKFLLISKYILNIHLKKFHYHIEIYDPRTLDSISNKRKNITDNIHVSNSFMTTYNIVQFCILNGGIPAVTL